ncbi:MAG: hypothetical protein DIZ80_02520 [endosymbiont of Galathealinum brachiosum]|uniref:Sensor protein FixL n=1 Tax=endosymbiont of Galathealinum brachiosum TaxID=2200906 RepID=A0A370DL75_9GAMM|nr:MAG: hypothetical protein DIZ80_02520 [endosymbiont of Galathealinum brachiosum]
MLNQSNIKTDPSLFMEIKNKRIQSYMTVAIVLSLGSIMLSGSSWQGSAYLHTLMEMLATVLALFVGLLALVRFYSRGGTEFLVLGSGFIGVSLLDGYHAVVSSIWFKAFLPSDLPSLIPWSWLASRMFLSIVVLLLYFILKWESENKVVNKLSPRMVYGFILITTLCSFLFFAFIPLPSGYFEDAFFYRPAELIPASFFALALIGFLKQGDWRTNIFTHWLILTIIVNLVSQLIVMPYSSSLFDVQFDMAHLLKKLSYLCVLTGLCISVFHAFKDADSQAKFRKKTQISLEASEVRNRTMMNSLVDGLISINEKGTIENINNSACILFGYSKLEVLGKNVNILMPSPYHENHDRYLSDYKETGNKNVIGSSRHVSGLKKNGSVFPMDLSVSEMTISGKVKYSAIIRDDTERLRNENELINAKNEAQMAAEAKSNFLATMSHEIRTPMNGVLGMVELLQETKLDYRQEDIVSTISESGSSLLEIINDILEYSKIEAGKLDIDSYTFNLERTIYDVTRLLLVKAEEKSIELIFYFHTDCPEYVNGDAGRIRQIMLNLIGNAIKFTDTGQVVIEVKLNKDKEKNINISVSDTGIGLSNKQKDRIFESFTQADSSTSRTYGGTGLGLAISKQLIELMNGSLDVESEPGKGSKFWIDLSLTETEAPEKLEKADLNNVKVLIVDDNPINLQILNEQLTKLGMIVDKTLNPHDVIELMLTAKRTNEQYQLVIIDNMMPELSGDKLGINIIANDELKNTPLVLLTSATGLGDAAKFNEIGFLAYLTKPILSELLYKTLSRVLSIDINDKKNERFLTRHSVIEDEQETEKNRPVLQGHVLLVEDILINQKVATGLMSDFDITVDIANNGQEAIDKYKKNKYDIILMDCQMPIMDGFEATRIIRESDKNLPIIAVTANALSSDREKCESAGMNDYLAKPFNRKQLTSILSKWLSSTENTVDGNEFEKTAHAESKVDTGKSPLNYETLSTMKAAIGAVFDELIPAYIEQSDEMIYSMIELFDKEDFSTLERYAHSMKSSSLNVGAEIISAHALTLENMCRNGTDNSEIRKTIEIVINEYGQTKSALLDYQNKGE